MEDLWLGPWRYLLLGECLDCERLDLIHKKLVHDLKCKSQIDVNESLLKIIVWSAKYSHRREQCFLQLCLHKGRFIGKVGFYDEKTMCKVFSNHYLFLELSYDPTFVLQTYGAIEVHEIWLFIKSYLQVHEIWLLCFLSPMELLWIHPPLSLNLINLCIRQYDVVEFL